jgi:hypothetical protein
MELDFFLNRDSGKKWYEIENGFKQRNQGFFEVFAANMFSFELWCGQMFRIKLYFFYLH